MADKNFKTVLFGYEKSAVDEEISRLQTNLDRIAEESKEKIKQAQLIASEANKTVDTLQKELDKLKEKLESLSSEK